MRLDDSNLLTALHEGAFEQPLWHSFLLRIRERTNAGYVSLIFRPIDDQPIFELSTGESPPLHLRALFHEKFVRDPLPYRNMREGRVYRFEELIDPAEPLHRAFLDELILPWGMIHSQSIRVAEPGGSEAWLGCLGRADIGSSVSALMSALAPHLRIALRTFATLERERARSTLTSEAFRRLDFGWLTLDARCRIIDMTEHMEQMFRRSTVLRRGRYGRLTPESPTVDRQVTALVKQFAQDPDLPPRAINLARDPLMDMLLRPLRDGSVVSPSPPVAIAYVSGDRWSQADRCDQLVDMFGLLPSEARLAWSIAQGRSIAEAAVELGLTIETARNYSKKIYAKTGSRGQSSWCATC
ncbi:MULTISPECIES: helix-turn-helix transcriptional regulator [unclassified Sphingobium]|uniref:helix-turn-helix transcriptional regulator n=1 Tax=unclassified Sphingobium TaxID=2611147 RepID=UPI00119C8C88|nr:MULTISPECIES: helix-turn-helix transcriptional regulator [unclassified Sphingobium]MBG6119996.1 DNA-binding CsgD family transcriptional regulator [Sphingobium sp. JAI105]TWD05802.1 DNA-binding CsgD family transcriptional regulator [Sphingobium sp. AEW010]TWD23355.1 DNA-binding CsgD family transcriptional regulator [Sphingobium sp. AEW013]TWD25215.1 DNA-binding CsgD family transcriptional regulator [Sphingobium sp. AEW001]